VVSPWLFGLLSRQAVPWAWRKTLWLLGPLLLTVPPAGAQLIYGLQANLSGAEVVPPTFSSGGGYFEGICPSGCYGTPGDSMHVQVWYYLPGANPIGCSLHLGQRTENGPLLHTLFSGFFANGSQVTIPIGPEGGDLWSGRVYVVIRTDAYQDGEIRGQLRPAPDLVDSSTWGRVKAVYGR
jgi:hypothetical protein